MRARDESAYDRNEAGLLSPERCFFVSEDRTLYSRGAQMPETLLDSMSAGNTRLGLS